MATLPPVLAADTSNDVRRTAATSRRKSALHDAGFGLVLGAASAQWPAPTAPVAGGAVAREPAQDRASHVRAGLKHALGDRGTAPIPSEPPPKTPSAALSGAAPPPRTVPAGTMVGAAALPVSTRPAGTPSTHPAAGTESRPTGDRLPPREITSTPKTRPVSGSETSSSRESALPFESVPAKAEPASRATPRAGEVWTPSGDAALPMRASATRNPGVAPASARMTWPTPVQPLQPADLAGLSGAMAAAIRMESRGVGATAPTAGQPPRTSALRTPAAFEATVPGGIRLQAGAAAAPESNADLALLHRLAAMRPLPGAGLPAANGQPSAREEAPTETTAEKVRRGSRRDTREASPRADTPEPAPTVRWQTEEAPASRRAVQQAEGRRTEPVTEPGRQAVPAAPVQEPPAATQAVRPETGGRPGAEMRERAPEPMNTAPLGPGRTHQTPRPPGAEAPMPAARSAAAAMPAWVEALMERSGPAAPQTAWKSLEMQLDDGDGLVTIHVLRQQEKVAVSVGFSDPTLRAQAEGQVAQIVETLQAHYQADIDFSFYASGRDSGAGETPDSPAGGARKQVAAASGLAAATPPTPAPARASSDGRREWVG